MTQILANLMSAESGEGRDGVATPRATPAQRRVYIMSIVSLPWRVPV